MATTTAGAGLRLRVDLLAAAAALRRPDRAPRVHRLRPRAGPSRAGASVPVAGANGARLALSAVGRLAFGSRLGPARDGRCAPVPPLSDRPATAATRLGRVLQRTGSGCCGDGTARAGLRPRDSQVLQHGLITFGRRQYVPCLPTSDAYLPRGADPLGTLARRRRRQECGGARVGVGNEPMLAEMRELHWRRDAWVSREYAVSPRPAPWPGGSPSRPLAPAIAR